MSDNNLQIIGFINGKFDPVSKIKISVDNLAVNRGYGAFDFFGVINNKAFHLERHLDRFFRSMELLRLKIKYSRNEVKTLIESVIQKNKETNYFIKLFALPLTSDIAPTLESELFILPVNIEAYDELVYKTGGSLITKEYARFLPEAKSTNYLPMVFWYPEITKFKAIDVLYYYNNLIHETSRGNIFIVKDKQVYTPANDVLKGITRSVVIDILITNLLDCIEKEISLDELLEADEVFLTSTTKKVLPITYIDEKIIGNGEVGAITKKIMQSFLQVQDDLMKIF